MALSKGARLGPYEILALHGVGGMGEVYRARDSRLDRVVAIKVLSTELANDADVHSRFEREARAVAALSHPNICAVHDVGEMPTADGPPTRFIVMEYLEGETLAARLSRGPLPLAEALDRAIELGEALDRAHRHGVVHRDVKPANIMLTKLGAAKLLDFGLARTEQGAATVRGSGGGATALPGMTGQGTILGTFEYMAPEQVAGERADARTDVFALGVVLYEMVTGKKAFDGKSQVSIIAAILERDPVPVSTYRNASPPALDAVIKRCLAKDPAERWQSAGDLSAALKLLRGPGAERVAAANSPERVRRSRVWLPLAAALAATAALAAWLGHRLWLAPGPSLVRLEITAPASTAFGTPFAASESSGVISPDGRTVAFTATSDDGTTLLWLRPLDAAAAIALPGTSGAELPFWAPDGRFVGFFANGKLRKVPVEGGTPETIADAPTGGGAVWGTDGTILFGPNVNGGLWRVGANGGEPVAVTTVGQGQAGHRSPSFVPGGRRFLYYATGTAEGAGIYVGALDSRDSTRVIAGEAAATYSSSGHLLFVRGNTLFAQRFDSSSLRFSGEPVRIAEQVSIEGAVVPPFSVSETGVLTYRSSVGYGDQQFAWFDRSGELLATVGGPGPYRGVDLSPDGTRVAVHRHDGDGGDVWVVEPRGTITRLTFDPSYDNSMPIWSPDGQRIAFGSFRDGQWGIYQIRSDGGGAAELLVESEVMKTPMDWTPDGASILYWTGAGSFNNDLWLQGVGGGEATPLLRTSFSESHPQVSPNGQWVAYRWNSSGRAEIYVAGFPSGEPRWQVSTSGGTFPRWRGDGRELFYLTTASRGDVMAVAVEDRGSTLDLGAPQRLFASAYINVGHTGGNWHTYAVAPDGQRFLIPRPTANVQGETWSAPISVVLNWTRLLETDSP